MKKWLMLALLPLLLAQQEAGATPITTIEIFRGSYPTIAPFTSFTLQMNNSRDVIAIAADFDSSVSLVAAANAQAPNTPVLNNSLTQLLITNNQNGSPGFQTYLSIVTVGFNPSTNIVTSVSRDPFLTNFNVNTTLNEITAKLGKTSDSGNSFNTVSSWFDTDYWTPTNNNNPYACMRERANFNPTLCGTATAVRFPFGPAVPVVPVANSSMLLVIGLAALMIPLRRTRQS